LKKILLAIGNELKGDDGAGIIVGKYVQDMCENEWIVYIAGMSPEAYIFKIIKEKPDLLVIVDATLMNKKPGEFYIVPLEKVAKELMISTHRIPMDILISLLKENCKRIYFIGVQPKILEFGEPTKEIIDSCQKIAKILCEGGLDKIEVLK